MGHEPLETDAYQDDNADLDGFDTVERFECMEEELSGEERVGPDQALRVLSNDEIEEPDTQHQVVMVARTGLLRVRIPGGDDREFEA